MVLPSVAVASRLGERGVGVMVDGQMQHIDTGASLSGNVGVGVVATGTICLAVAIPCIDVTCRFGIFGIGVVVNCQVQSVGACTVLSGGVIIGVVATGFVDNVVPSITLAHGLVVGVVSGLVDSDVNGT